MPEILIVYYSRTGTTRQAAQQLAALTGWPLGELTDERSRAGALGDFRCVVDSLLLRRPAYGYQGAAFTGSEHLIVMAPVWVGRLASPMRAFLHDWGPLKVPLSAILVMASRGALRAGEDVAKITGRLPRPLLALRQREIENGEAINELKRFVEDVQAERDSADSAPRGAWLSPREA